MSRDFAFNLLIVSIFIFVAANMYQYITDNWIRVKDLASRVQKNIYLDKPHTKFNAVIIKILDRISRY